MPNISQLFGIDNISGKHHYVTNLPNFGEFANGQPMKVIVQRTSKHFPYPSRCTILAKHSVNSSENILRILLKAPNDLFYFIIHSKLPDNW